MFGFEHPLPRLAAAQHVRYKSNLPFNTIIMFVPQQEVSSFRRRRLVTSSGEILFFRFFQAWIVERMGKFFKILQPGLNILVPIIDQIKYVQCLKELAIEIPQQSAVTSGTLLMVNFERTRPVYPDTLTCR